MARHVLQDAGMTDDVQELLTWCAEFCVEGGASCGVALAQGGLLRTAVEWAAKVTASKRGAASQSGASVIP